MHAAFAVIVKTADQGEAADGCLVPGLDRRFDHRPGQAFERGLQPLIAEIVGRPVRRDEKIVGGQAHLRTDRLAAIFEMHQLRDAVDQDIPVKHGRQAACAGDDLDFGVVMLVGESARLWPWREREDGMFHGSHVGARRDIQDIENEKILIGMALGKKLRHNLDLAIPGGLAK